MHEKKAVLFRSKNRFPAFKQALENNGFKVKVLEFETDEWITFDYSEISLVIYFPEFLFSSNNPQALTLVYNNIAFLNKNFPHIRIFPDPNIINYYSDKYSQYLFLKKSGLPHIPTRPLVSSESLGQACDLFSFPMIIKNRYGAGGDHVYIINNRKELERLYQYSKLNFTSPYIIPRVLRRLLKREFWWYFFKARKLYYPFLSFPLLAQKFIEHDKDLKSVVGFHQVVEAHWRKKANVDMWKMNIDGGGIGEWSYVPEEPIEISINLSRELKADWVNIDFMCDGDDYLISEFSPVWHHYKINENDNFVYKDDYNLSIPLEEALNLEELIVKSYSDHFNEVEKNQIGY